MLDAVVSVTLEAGKHKRRGFFSPLGLGHLEATAGKLQHQHQQGLRGLGSSRQQNTVSSPASSEPG